MNVAGTENVCLCQLRIVIIDETPGRPAGGIHRLVLNNEILRYRNV